MWCDKMTNRRFFLAIFVVIFVLFSGCSANEKTSPTESTDTCVTSQFVGEWICLSENSCNGKKIVLTISQNNNQLNIVRDMESGSSSGSKIIFTVDVPNENSFSSSNTNATYALNDNILTEEFKDGKTNYYSATGELSTNICHFPFCSSPCGDTLYCELHSTEEERYNCLSDGNKKSIGYYIQGRYDYYDTLNSGYSGDKYSDTIMQEAADKYGLSIDHIKIIWMNFYSY